MAVPAEQAERVFRELAEVLAPLGKEALYDVLQALLTRREREKIALRWELVRLLEAGMTQRDIAARLGVSLCKITRGSRELKYGPAAFRTAVRRSVEKKVK